MIISPLQPSRERISSLTAVACGGAASVSYQSTRERHDAFCMAPPAHTNVTAAPMKADKKLVSSSSYMSAVAPPQKDVLSESSPTALLSTPPSPASTAATRATMSSSGTIATSIACHTAHSSSRPYSPTTTHSSELRSSSALPRCLVRVQASQSSRANDLTGALPSLPSSSSSSPASPDVHHVNTDRVHGQTWSSSLRTGGGSSLHGVRCVDTDPRHRHVFKNEPFSLSKVVDSQDDAVCLSLSPPLSRFRSPLSDDASSLYTKKTGLVSTARSSRATPLFPRHPSPGPVRHEDRERDGCRSTVSGSMALGSSGEGKVLGPPGGPQRLPSSAGSRGNAQIAEENECPAVPSFHCSPDKDLDRSKLSRPTNGETSCDFQGSAHSTRVQSNAEDLSSPSDSQRGSSCLLSSWSVERDASPGRDVKKTDVSSPFYSPPSPSTSVAGCSAGGSESMLDSFSSSASACSSPYRSSVNGGGGGFRCCPSSSPPSPGSDNRESSLSSRSFLEIPDRKYQSSITCSCSSLVRVLPGNRNFSRSSSALPNHSLSAASGADPEEGRTQSPFLEPGGRTHAAAERYSLSQYISKAAAASSSSASRGCPGGRVSERDVSAETPCGLNSLRRGGDYERIADVLEEDPRAVSIQQQPAEAQRSLLALNQTRMVLSSPPPLSSASSLFFTKTVSHLLSLRSASPSCSLSSPPASAKKRRGEDEEEAGATAAKEPEESPWSYLARESNRPFAPVIGSYVEGFTSSSSGSSTSLSPSPGTSPSPRSRRRFLHQRLSSSSHEESPKSSAARGGRFLWGGSPHQDDDSDKEHSSAYRRRDDHSEEEADYDSDDRERSVPYCSTPPTGASMIRKLWCTQEKQRRRRKTKKKRVFPRHGPENGRHRETGEGTPEGQERYVGHKSSSDADDGHDAEEERSQGEEEARRELEKEPLLQLGHSSFPGEAREAVSSSLPNRSARREEEKRRRSHTRKLRDTYSREKKQLGSYLAQRTSDGGEADQRGVVADSLREESDADEVASSSSLVGVRKQRDESSTEDSKEGKDSEVAAGVQALQSPSAVVVMARKFGDDAGVGSSSVVEGPSEGQSFWGEDGANGLHGETLVLPRNGRVDVTQEGSQEKGRTSLRLGEAEQGGDSRCLEAPGALESPSSGTPRVVAGGAMPLAKSRVAKTRTTERSVAKKHRRTAAAEGLEDRGQLRGGDGEEEEEGARGEQGLHRGEDEAKEEEELDDNAEREVSPRRPSFMHRGRSLIRRSRKDQKGSGEREEAAECYHCHERRSEKEILSGGGAQGAVAGFQLLTEGTLLGELLFGVGGGREDSHTRRRRHRKRNAYRRRPRFGGDDGDVVEGDLSSSSSAGFSRGRASRQVRTGRRERRCKPSLSSSSSRAGMNKYSSEGRKGSEGQEESISGGTTTSKSSAFIRRLGEARQEVTQRRSLDTLGHHDENAESSRLISSRATGTDEAAEGKQRDNDTGRGRRPRRRCGPHSEREIDTDERRVLTEEGSSLRGVARGGEVEGRPREVSGEAPAVGESGSFSLAWFKQITEQLSSAAFPASYSWEGAKQSSTDQSRSSSLSSSLSNSRARDISSSSSSSGSQCMSADSRDERSSGEEDEEEAESRECYEMSSRALANAHQRSSSERTTTLQDRHGRFAYVVSEEEHHRRYNGHQGRQAGDGRGGCEEDAAGRGELGTGRGGPSNLDSGAHPSSFLWTTAGWCEGRRGMGNLGETESSSSLLPYAIVEQEEEDDHGGGGGGGGEGSKSVHVDPGKRSEATQQPQRKPTPRAPQDRREATIAEKEKEGEREERGRNNEEDIHASITTSSSRPSSPSLRRLPSETKGFSAVVLRASSVVAEGGRLQSPSKVPFREQSGRGGQSDVGGGKCLAQTWSDLSAHHADRQFPPLVSHRGAESTHEGEARAGRLQGEEEGESKLHSDAQRRHTYATTNGGFLLYPRTSEESSESSESHRNESKKVHPRQPLRCHDPPPPALSSINKEGDGRTTRARPRKSDDGGGDDREGPVRVRGFGALPGPREGFWERVKADYREGEQPMDRYKERDDVGEELNRKPMNGTMMTSAKVQPHGQEEEALQKPGVFSSFTSLATWLSPDNMFSKGRRQSPSWLDMEAMGERESSGYHESWEGEAVGDEKHAVSPLLPSSSSRERKTEQALRYMTSKKERIREQETQADGEGAEDDKTEDIATADSSSSSVGGALASFSRLYSSWGRRLG